jgi:anti-anti-sigma factor
MNDHQPHPGTAVVRLPAEIDMTNVAEVGEQLRMAIAPGITAVVADLTATTFCDSAGIRQLVMAHGKAAACGVQLRLAAPESGAVDRVLELLGLDQLLPKYATVEAAIAAHEPDR